MTKPSLTVIIPAYNCEKYINKLLCSLNNQIYKDFCILVVDDHSTDGTLNALKKYNNIINLKIIPLPENHGVSYARNIGIQYAETQYITFIDQDDWIDINTFYNGSQYFKNNIDIINYGLSYDYLDYLQTEKKYIYARNFIVTGEYALKIYGHTIQDEVKITPIVNNKIYNMKFIRDNNIYFNEETRYQEDDIFTFKALLSAKSVAFIAGSYYHYLQNPNSAIHQVSETSINHFVKSYSHLQEYLKSNRKFEQYKDEFYLKFKASLKGVIRRTVEYGQNPDIIRRLLASLYKQLSINFDIEEFLIYCDLHKL